MLPAAPILSIIIVAYKSRDEITGCLVSLPQASGGRSVEVVVVDNSPGDGAREIVQRQFPWVKYIAPETNLGFGRANNLGYTQTNPASEFVLFLNPDTVCNETALAHCIARLQADERIGLISPKLVLADGSMDLACRRSIPTLWDGFCRASGLAAAFSRTALFSGYNLTHLPVNGTYDVGAINGAFMMGRREVFAAVAAAPVALVEDLKLKFKAHGRAERGESGGRAGPLGPPDTSQPSDPGAPGGHALPSEQCSELKARPLAPVEDFKFKLKGEEGVTSSREDGRSEFTDSATSTSNLSLQRTRASNARAPRAARVFDERFFMYGDDLDLCIRVARAGWRIVYDGSVSITHLKGVSVAKDYELMSRAIFDANREVYLKHFNPRDSWIVRWKYSLAFGAWKRIAGLWAMLRGHRRVRPL